MRADTFLLHSQDGTTDTERTPIITVRSDEGSTMQRLSQALLLAAALLGLLTAGCGAPCTVPGDCPLDPIGLCLDKPTAAPPPSALALGGVRTVLDPDAPPRPISLAECIALAVENGRVNGESIRVLAYDPAILGTDIESALSRFDARWQSSLTWGATDRPSGISALNTAAALQQQNVQTASFDSQLLKPLPTGGLAGITFRSDYQYTNQQADLNPIYNPTLAFTF